MQALALTVRVNVAALLLAWLEKNLLATIISCWLCRRHVNVPFCMTALVVVACMRSPPSLAMTVVACASDAYSSPCVKRPRGHDRSRLAFA